MKLCLAVLVGSMFSCALAQGMLELSFKGASELTPEELKLADRAASIMTGSDFALIRSVEFFEDYAARPPRSMSAKARMSLMEGLGLRRPAGIACFGVTAALTRYRAWLDWPGKNRFRQVYRARTALHAAACYNTRREDGMTSWQI